MFLSNIDNPVKVRNQLKRMYKLNPQFCYTWDFETRQVCGLDKSEYVTSLYEVQINSLVKRCECWVKQRFIIQKQPSLQQNERKSHSNERSETKCKSPKLSAINHNSNNSSAQQSQTGHGNSNNSLYSPIIPQHDKFVIRFESYGHSKRERMTQSINPLSYAFDKVLVDYVYLFIETEEVSRQKLIKEINRSISNARYYDATRKVTMLEDVFNEKNTPQIQAFMNTINQKKREQEVLNQILISNLPLAKHKSQSSNSQNGKNLRSSDAQKKQQNQQTTSTLSDQSNITVNNKQPLKEASGDNKANTKQTVSKDKGISSSLIAQNSNVQNSQQVVQNNSQFAQQSPHNHSPNHSNSQSQQSNQSQLQQQSHQPPFNSVASQTRTRSPLHTHSTPTPAFNLSPNKPSSLQSLTSPSKQHVPHGSPKKVSAFNASPSKSTIAASFSDNQSPKKIPSSSSTTRSAVQTSPKKIPSQSPKKIPSQSPKKIISQSPKKIISQSARISTNPSPKSTAITKQSQPQNIKSTQNEISTRSQSSAIINSNKDIPVENQKQKRKTINENEKPENIPSISCNLQMQTRQQEQILIQQQSKQ